MFKFVVACAFLAVAAASPGLLLGPQITYSTGVAPAVTTYSAASGLINPAQVVYNPPVAYSTNYGYTHLIKKRSPGLLANYIATAPIATSYSTYGAPLTTTYTAAAPFATYGAYGAAPIATSYSSPLVHSAPVYSHLIKKRSVYLSPAPATYIAPNTYAAAPAVSAYSSYPAAATVVSTPYLSAGPYAYTQFIKK